MSIREFVRKGSQSQPNVAARALLLADALLRGPEKVFDNRPYAVRVGVYGVGVAVYQGTVRPALLVVGSPAEKPIGIVRESPVGALMADLVDFETYGDLIAVPTSAPELQVAPGDAIRKPKLGILGAGVKWTTGQGFLTVGHVAPTLGVAVIGQAGQIGTVVYANDPSGHGAIVEEDAAVIEVSSSVRRTGLFSSSTVPGPNDAVSVLRSGKPNAPASIMGSFQWLYMPGANGTYGEVYSTTMQATYQGDSGAPVMDSSNVLIGHVLGASPQFSSYVQDVAYQLKSVASRSKLGGIALG